MKTRAAIFACILTIQLVVLPIGASSDIPHATPDVRNALDDGNPPAPADGTSPGSPSSFTIAELIGLINATNMGQSILELQNFGTRDALAPNNAEVVAFLEERMSRSGAPTATEPFVWSGHPMDNVIAEIPGTAPGTPDIVIACAHFDSYTGDPFNAPGADDDGSGSAAVMLMAEILAQFEWNRTIRLCAFNGEEYGLLGSDYHASESAARGDPILAVYNLDMIGYCGDDSLLDVCYTDGSSFPGLDCEWIADTIVDVDDYYGLGIDPQKVYVGLSAMSDHYPFWQNGYEAVFMIEKRELDYPYYHKTTDTVDKLNLTYAAEVAKATMAAICELAGPNPSGDVSGPYHSAESPGDGSLSQQVDHVSVEVTDPLGIDPSTIELWVDGVPASVSLTPIVFGQRASTPASFVDGSTHSARVRASDDSGNWLDWNWTFTIEAVPPEAPANLTVDVSGTSILLTWDPSPSPDVVEYRVFRAALPGSFNWGSPSATTTGSSHTFANDASSLGLQFYAVRAVDAAGNMDLDPAILGKNTLRPNLGWMLLGNPFVLHEPDPIEGFHLLGSYWTDATAYASDPGEWRTRSRTAPEWCGNLREVDPDQGFWLNTTASFQKLCLCGEALVNATIPLHKGWNLVAYPGYSMATVSDALSGVPWDMVQWGDPASTPYHLTTLTGSDYMMVGWGYWVHVTEDCVWTYAN